MTEYIDLYSPRQMRRHEVLPGITGFAQVNGRNAITWEQKFEYDVLYVEKVKWFVDFKILVKTVVNVIRREGVNSSAAITAEIFMGNDKANPPNADTRHTS